MMDPVDNPEHQAQSQAFDEGCRHLIRLQLRHLVGLAEDQERRACSTASRRSASDLDKDLCTRDAAFVEALKRALDP